MTGYAVPQLLWREQAVPARGVWIVHLDPAAAGRGAVQAVLRQADQLAHTLLQGPMTVVVDAVLDIGGEQLHAALSLGRERAMFPRLEVELADWGMLLPPAGRWQASPVRELHLPPHLMLPALARFAGAADLVILLSSTVEPVEAWKQRFRHADDLVVWHRGDLEPAPAMPPAPATGTASPGTSGKR
ncbi:hypothetical protein [Massilia sp. S19_KUP03_FR1]|uniref:hypothetical protein n=1 Tax=Massilia sp. S19_KUP03_FR1 TaxID=3025503 RepID=UPI002FCD8F69